MNPFILSWIGPCLFLTSLAVQVLNRGQWMFLNDGLFLLFFLIQNRKKARVFSSHVLWLIPFVATWAINHFHEPVYFLSLLLASQISLFGMNFVIEYEDKLKQLEKENLFISSRCLKG